MTKSYKYQRVTAAHTTQLAEIAEREGAGGWRLVYVFHNGSSGPHQFEALLELEVVPGPALDPLAKLASATIKTEDATAENMPTARELQEVCAKCNTTLAEHAGHQWCPNGSTYEDRFVESSIYIKPPEGNAATAYLPQLAELISVARRLAGMGPREFAEAAMLKPSRLLAIEKGREQFTATELGLIVEQLRRQFNQGVSRLSAYGNLYPHVAKLAEIANVYDQNGLDEARPEWVESGVRPRKDFSEVELLAGRGGHRLLTLEDCMRAREALQSYNHRPMPASEPAVEDMRSASDILAEKLVQERNEEARRKFDENPSRS